MDDYFPTIFQHHLHLYNFEQLCGKKTETQICKVRMIQTWNLVLGALIVRIPNFATLTIRPDIKKVPRTGRSSIRLYSTVSVLCNGHRFSVMQWAVIKRCTFVEHTP